MLDTSSSSKLLPLPTSPSTPSHPPTSPSPPTTSTTSRCPWRTSPSTWVSPSAQPTWVSVPVHLTISRENTTGIITINFFTFANITNFVFILIQYFRGRLILIITPGLECVHLHHLLQHQSLQHQDGAVLEKRWRNSIDKILLLF
eukprot:TRINITY_DN16700_c0_g1_i1.p1 TRINITY_DN16700_c0_g1~~TRINITY_DN16700_c0_g1_i1.p1  ORF type:complete len:145 (+),score=20.93 TRINITY_DN16700_c0_g1_i1:378-812(+)